MSYTKEEYLELVNSGLVVGSAVEGYEVGYAAGAEQLAEANKKLALYQASRDSCHNYCALLAKAKEEGRAEAQASIYSLEKMLRMSKESEECHAFNARVANKAYVEHDAKLVEAQAHIKVLEGYAEHRNDGVVFCELLKHSENKCTCGLDDLLSTTSKTEALDKVVLEAVEKQVAGKFCRHCGKEVAKTGHDAFCPVVTGNAIP